MPCRSHHIEVVEEVVNVPSVLRVGGVGILGEMLETGGVLEVLEVEDVVMRRETPEAR